MAKILAFIVPLMAAISIVLSIYCLNLEDQKNIRISESIELLKEINNNNTIISKSAVDSLRNEIIQLKFEKESYSNHLGLMSDWFIFFQTILFGIFFLVGYGVFDQKVAQIVKETDNKISQQNEFYAHFKSEFLDLKTSSLMDSCSVNEILAESNRLSGGGDKFLLYGIEAARKARLIYDLEKSDISLAKLSDYLGNIRSGLNSFYKDNKFGLPGNEFFENKQREVLEISNLDNIKEIGNIINRQLSEIIKKNEIWLSDDKNEMPTDTKM